ncbi:hypothetical protein AX15_003515 [Amanita polypyramis BW_CC]|nr:hypothetical protein AX15_003515 [Amanita polypyramis BW_CC]
MRSAAIAAGLVENEAEALKRVIFVTEGEASIYFYLKINPDVLEKYDDDGMVVVNYDDGTICVSTYIQPLKREFREIVPAEHLQGTSFVTRRARAFLTEKLRGSEYGNPKTIGVMTRYFDKITRPSFKDPSKSYLIRFGASGNDPKFDIMSGFVKIKGSQIAEFFEPTIQSIIQAIETQSRRSLSPIRVICMVGRFATSDYLLFKLNKHFKTRNINILREAAYLSNAVSGGAILSYAERSIHNRTLTRAAYPSPLPQIPDICNNVKLPKRNKEFYIDHTFVTIRVEDELFKLPRYTFTEHSPVFRSMLNVPTSHDHKLDGSSDERPLILGGIKALEFVRLVRCIWPMELGGRVSNVSLEDWQSVLKLATLYEMAEVKALAIEHMTPLLEKSPSLQIRLAKAHNVQEWLASGFYKLVRRKTPLDEYDIQLLGLTDALKVMSIREDRKFDSGSCKNYICRYKSDFPFSMNDDEFRRRFNL